MRAAAAEIAGEPLLGLFERRLRRRREQRRGGHDHPAGAVAALRGLLGDERGLHAMRRFSRVPSPSMVVIVVAGGAADRRHARAHRFAVHQHRAGAALAEAAAELRPVQRERTAQNVEQRLRRIPRVGGDRAAVEAKRVAWPCVRFYNPMKIVVAFSLAASVAVSAQQPPATPAMVDTPRSRCSPA